LRNTPKTGRKFKPSVSTLCADFVAEVGDYYARVAEQFEGYAACCLRLARSAKTAAGRARFLQMAHEYRLATLRIRKELSPDRKVVHADHHDGTNWPSVSGSLILGLGLR